MTPLEPQDWDELASFLKDAEESLAAISAGDAAKEMEKSRRCLLSFHTTAAMLGLESLEKAGVELEKFLAGEVSSGNIDSIAVLGFAVRAVIDQMRTFGNGNGSAQIDLNEVLEILGQSETAARAPDDDQSPPAAPEICGTKDEACHETPAGSEGTTVFNNLGELVKSWGGELSLSSNGGGFSLSLSGPGECLKKIENFLSVADRSAKPLQCPAEDVSIEKVMARGQEFIDAFSMGDLPRAQEILLSLADNQTHASGLYKEIGSLARRLHDSIRGFLNSLDPSLQEIAVDKIPDSGNRLEHMMEMTEKAAITTLDHVEAMQERLSSELEQISGLRAIFEGLNAIGDSAGKKLAQGAQALNAMETIIGQHRSDLDIIMSAQDYQDLSGQIILKIMQLLKDLELKLVGLIRTFGVKAETVKQKTGDGLYGPAHAVMDNAVHCQDEVDSLLADFGF